MYKYTFLKPAVNLKLRNYGKLVVTKISCYRMFIFIFAFSITLRQLWLFTLINRDEGGLAITALGWLNGFIPYTYFDNNAGPLAYIIYMIPTYFLGSSFIYIRIINNILFYSSIITLYALVKQWYGNRVALSSCLFYGIFMNAPIYEGQIALTSSLSAPFIIFSVFFANRYIKDNTKNVKSNLFLSAILLSFALVIKFLTIFVIFIIFVVIATNYFLLHRKTSERQIKRVISDCALVIIGFVTIPCIFLLYFWKIGAIDDLIRIFVEQTLLRRLPNVPFGITFYVIAEGLPLWIFCCFGIIACIIRRAPQSIVILSWLLIGFLLASFPPNFGHRYIYLVAPASILAGFSFTTVLNQLLNHRSMDDVNEQRLLVYFIVSILLLSTFVALNFQKEQFPNYNIKSNWLGFQWLYADAESYSEQISLVEYLKSSSTPISQILVHGWAAEIYYLLGIMPPSKYVWSQPGTGISIPPHEYNMLVDKIKNYKFDYVVFYDYGFYGLRYRMEDPVVAETVKRYFLVNVIGKAIIFDKHDKNNRYITYNFIDNFANAEKTYKASEGIAVETSEAIKSGVLEELFLPVPSRLNINDEERFTFRQVPINSESQVTFKNVSIPPYSTLKFGIGIEPWTWERKGGDGVLFKIYVVQSNGEADEVFSEFINPKQISEHRKWIDREVNLSKYANQTVQIIFVTTPGPANDVFDDWAHWSVPVILTKKL